MSISAQTLVCWFLVQCSNGSFLFSLIPNKFMNWNSSVRKSSCFFPICLLLRIFICMWTCGFNFILWVIIQYSYYFKLFHWELFQVGSHDLLICATHSIHTPVFLKALSFFLAPLHASGLFYIFPALAPGTTSSLVNLAFFY